MKTRSLPDVGSLRRKQIVEAAVAVIAEQGLQHCSLSAIEKRAGMCRGQLTYYFPTKEEILLAVFDHLVGLLKQRAHGESGATCWVSQAQGWERLKSFLTLLLLEPPAAPEFHSLQYTFLSQIAHREDFRRRLADLYQEWRNGMAQDCEMELAQRPGAVSARTVASLIQAVLQGLAVQRDADPKSYDPQEMLRLCLDLLGSYLRPQAPDAGPGRRSRKKRVSANGSTAAGGAARRIPRSSRT
jgi:AcrR family transcriptional regulator